MAPRWPFELRPGSQRDRPRLLLPSLRTSVYY